MMTGTLIRIASDDQGTFGILHAPGVRCYILEPPWRENRPGISCIPAGSYEVEPWNSARFPLSYHVTGVGGRSAILTHTGNLAGDKSRGWITHSLGCILPGRKLGAIGGQKALLLSLPALNDIRKVMERRHWTLAIKWQKGEPQWNG